MADTRTITSAQYQKDFITETNASIVAVIDGLTLYVPLNADNTDYQAILEWVADGNTIAEAD
tara:strand:- start:153 stop:338 length:186 start_codon:yes stop_codon:yes gene_type:complete